MKTVVLNITFVFLSLCMYAQVDTLKYRDQAIDFLDSLSSIADAHWLTDSLTILSWADSLTLRVNNNYVSDSIRALNDHLNNKISDNALARQLHELSEKRTKLLAEVSEQQTRLNDKTRGRYKAWVQKIKSNIGLDSLSKSSGIAINDPNLSWQGLDLSGAPSIPGLDAKDFGNLNLSTELADLNARLPFGDLEKLAEIKSQLGEVSGSIAQAKGLLKNTDTSIDGLAGRIEPVRDVQKELGAVNQLKNNEFLQHADQLKNPEGLKQEGQQQVMKQAVNHFAGKEKELQQAMQSLSKYKAKYESVQSIRDLPKRRPNPMKNKPFVERLLPGVSFQIQKEQDFLLDVNPYLGYRITGKLTAGVGWNQRLAFAQWNALNSEARVFGPRAYTEFNAWKGFFPRVEIEVMNTYVPPLFRPLHEGGEREWVWGYFAGLKKSYRFYKNVRGTAMVMFNLYNAHHKSPYKEVVNTRFGFEFPLKQKRKPQEGTLSK